MLQRTPTGPPAATARRDGGQLMDVTPPAPGVLRPDQVAPDSLQGTPRLQTNPARWSGAAWRPFVEELRLAGVDVREERASTALHVTDAGGLSYGLPHGVVNARSARDVSAVLRAAQRHRVPVTTRGGGLTTEGESVAFGGLLLNMASMNRVLEIDKEAMTVRCEGGIFWHQLAEALRRQGLDYLSAPLNFTSSVGGTLAVGGIDVNSPKWGCSADQAVSLQVVTPIGNIFECSETQNAELFERVLLGYGQFGVVTEATLRVRPFTPCSLHYWFYGSLKTAIEDLRMVVRSEASDYCGILTMKDRGINLLVAFDSDEREAAFMREWKPKLRGTTEAKMAVRMALHYATHPWQWREALDLYRRKKVLLPEFTRPEHVRDGKLVDRTAVFSRAVWNHWGSRQMVIPDLATSEEKILPAVERGNRVLRKYFDFYTLYIVAIKIREGLPRYELSSIPPDAKGWAWGCEFEPIFPAGKYSRDYLQSFKNEIYDIGVEMKTSYYRFGGGMKGYIRRAFGDELVDRHLAMKRKADPAFILNPDVVF